MDLVTNFDKFNSLNESVKLSKDEKDFLWRKLEFRKRKKAEETEDALYDILKGDKDKIKGDDFNKILNSLEYTFRKKLTGLDKPMNSEVFKSIVDKIPSDWLGVKYSSLEAKKKRDEKKPTILSTKPEIIEYLKKNKIDFDESMSKKELIDLIK